MNNDNAADGLGGPVATKDPSLAALLSVLIGVGLATLDTAIANTALPAIASDLHALPAASIWIVNAYQLAVVAVLLPCSALADRLGARRVFMGGLAVFIAGSLLCATATGLGFLAAMRALQGVGAGAIMSVNLALIRQLFPPARLGRGVGFNALVVGLGFTLGPSVASLVLALASWPWLFALNVPLGLLALAAAHYALPHSPRRTGEFDTLGALLTAIAFAAFIFTLSSAAQREPWAMVLPFAALALGAGALVLRRQAGQAAPMLPVDLLSRPVFALSIATSVAAFATQGLAFVSLPFYFETVLHRSPVDTGFLMSAWPLVVAMAAPVAGRLSDRYRPGLLGGFGLAILCTGMASLALLPDQPTAFDIVWRMLLCGAGFGLFQSPNLHALMASAPRERSGGASAMIALARLTGQTSGAAMVALCFGLGGLHGPTWALWLGTGFAAMGCCASTARLWAR